MTWGMPAWRRFVPVGANIVAAGLLALMLLPRSVMEVAAKIGYEMHVVSFLLGPAIYAYGDGLVPGVDYYTQYSVGTPYLFSWLLDGNADHAVLSYVRVMVGAMVLFYWSLFFMLRWLLASWYWALGTTLIVLILQFHVERTFFDPSSYVLRYPLLVCTIAAVALWVGRGQRLGSGTLVTLAIGASLYLNTETGLYQMLAVSFTGLVASRGRWRSMLQVAVVISAAAAIFGLLCVLSFGFNVLDWRFMDGLIEPFVIYSGGYGGWAIDWRWGWHLLYNVIAPGVALMTAAWGTRWLWKTPAGAPGRAQIAALLSFSLLGIMMSAKYSNMSIIAIWYVNALGFIVVFAWWARQLQLALGDRYVTVLRMRMNVAKSLGAASAVFAVVLLLRANDPRNPALYAAHAYLAYPAIANPAAFSIRPACRELACAAPRIDPADVRMIARLVPEKQRAAVFGWYDWAYLVEARRPSSFHFLPSQATFTRTQIAKAGRLPDVVFLPIASTPDLGIKHPELAARMVPALRSEFEIAERGNQLVAWRRTK